MARRWTCREVSFAYKASFLESSLKWPNNCSLYDHLYVAYPYKKPTLNVHFLRMLPHKLLVFLADCILRSSLKINTIYSYEKWTHPPLLWPYSTLVVMVYATLNLHYLTMLPHKLMLPRGSWEEDFFNNS